MKNTAVENSALLCTEENKAEYIQLFVEHRLVGAIKEQVQAFQRGISVFFPPALLERLRKVCSPGDVKLLLSGTVEIDVDDWKTNTEYTNGFTERSNQVTWFWSVLRAFSVDDRAKVLDFATGSSRPPATGFKYLMGYSGNQQPFTVERSQKDAAHLPTAATCFNTLKLPRYKTKKILHEKLLAAISQSEGFDEGAAN